MSRYLMTILACFLVTIAAVTQSRVESSQLRYFVPYTMFVGEPGSQLACAKWGFSNGSDVVGYLKSPSARPVYVFCPTDYLTGGVVGKNILVLRRDLSVYFYQPGMDPWLVSEYPENWFTQGGILITERVIGETRLLELIDASGAKFGTILGPSLNSTTAVWPHERKAVSLDGRGSLKLRSFSGIRGPGDRTTLTYGGRSNLVIFKYAAYFVADLCAGDYPIAYALFERTGDLAELPAAVGGVPDDPTDKWVDSRRADVVLCAIDVETGVVVPLVHMRLVDWSRSAHIEFVSRFQERHMRSQLAWLPLQKSVAILDADVRSDYGRIITVRVE